VVFELQFIAPSYWVLTRRRATSPSNFKADTRDHRGHLPKGASTKSRCAIWIRRQREIEDGTRGHACVRPQSSPCASMMERQIDRPIPKTPGLVVYKAPKMRSRGARASPGLESCAATTTPSDLALAVLISNFRDLSPRPRIASIALMIKLRIPCCSWTRSP
jgi:hypothetical protein